MCSVFQKDRNFYTYILNNIKKFEKATSTNVYRIVYDNCSQFYNNKTKRAVTLRLKKHQTNCSNKIQHSVVVYYSDRNH